MCTFAVFTRAAPALEAAQFASVSQWRAALSIYMRVWTAVVHLGAWVIVSAALTAGTSNRRMVTERAQTLM